jgi:hypothetical protein
LELFQYFQPRHHTCACLPPWSSAVFSLAATSQHQGACKMHHGRLGLLQGISAFNKHGLLDIQAGNTYPQLTVTNTH